MNFFTVLVIAIGLSMDSLAVCIGSGICMRSFCIRQTLKMALIMGGFQGGMTLLGWALGTGFSSYITELDHWIAFLLLSYLGGKMIYESFKNENETITSLSNKTLFTLGIATSIDALAVGISFAFLKTDICFPVMIITLTTFLLSMTGVCCGFRFGKIKKLKIELLGGIILIIIGIKILFEHTLFQ